VQEPLRLDGEALGARFAGAVFVELPARLRSKRLSGVLIEELEPRSRLVYEGLRPGDIITGANRERIRSTADLKRVLDGLQGPLILQINRNGESYFARIE
jgi:S1-C subfamily serine protease